MLSHVFVSDVVSIVWRIREHFHDASTYPNQKIRVLAVKLKQLEASTFSDCFKTFLTVLRSNSDNKKYLF